MIQEIDPEHARRRYQKAVRERCVVGYLGRGGTATISASGLPATDSGTDSSRSEAAGGDTAGRGADCTDGSGSEAAGGDIGGSDTSVGETSGFRLRVGVEVRVGPATLLGLDERCGEIPGLGPVLPDVARTIVAAQQLAGDAGSCGPGRVSWPTSRGSSPIATRSSPGSTPAPATGSSAPRSLGTSRSATVPAAIRAAAGLPASQTRTTRTTMPGVGPPPAATSGPGATATTSTSTRAAGACVSPSPGTSSGPARWDARTAPGVLRSRLRSWHRVPRRRIRAGLPTSRRAASPTTVRS